MRPISGEERQGLTAVTHRAPVGADLPLAADLELAGAAGLGPIRLLTEAAVNTQRPVTVRLTTQNLTILYSQTTRLTALGPLADVPAEHRERERE